MKRQSRLGNGPEQRLSLRRREQKRSALFVMALLLLAALALLPGERIPVSPPAAHANPASQSTATETTPSAPSPPGPAEVAEDSLPIKVGERLNQILDLKMLVIDQYPVTIRKLLSALIVLVIGLAGVRAVSWSLRTRVLPRTHLQKTTAAVIDKVFYYAAVIMVILFALRMLNVPLAAFAFLGGAIAIGLGFGAQNLVNNFISGFIIMAERPIKIGDLVEVDGNFAMVEEIGARCTRIRTGSNVHILVPNSGFLEKSIINWTLSDQRIRTSVPVGVAYGSPVREVERLLMQAAKENDRIIQFPEPFVLFADFGDNALVFELFFWIRITRIIERRMIESSVRFRIDELFREAGIVIAFPQRDVHLDTPAPLHVKIIDGSARGTE